MSLRAVNELLIPWYRLMSSEWSQPEEDLPELARLNQPVADSVRLLDCNLKGGVDIWDDDGQNLHASLLALCDSSLQAGLAGLTAFRYCGSVETRTTRHSCNGTSAHQVKSVED
jgi:hypothetical protein